MIYTIENDDLLISVQQTGAELCRLYSKESGIEYMWDANPEVWGSYAPVLFPIVGGLKNGSYEFEGKQYQMPKHGIVRRNDQIELANQTSEKLSFRLKSDESTLQQYPFNFEIGIDFELNGKELRVTHDVINHEDRPMWFSLGGHPAFRVPMISGESYEDYFIEFEQEETAHTWVLDDKGLIAKEGEKILDNSNRLPLTHELFAHDALIFKSLKSRATKLCSSKSGPMLEMKYPGWDYLGIWAKPNGDFVCIEPWMGIADSSNASGKLEEKEGIIELDPQSLYIATYSIEILK